MFNFPLVLRKIPLDRNVYGAYCCPFHIAVQNNNIRAVQQLLKDFEVDVREFDHSTALHIAAKLGYLDIVKLLIQRNANVNAKKLEEFTPLHLSLQERHISVSEFLIANGANVNARDDEGWTPLHHAAYNGLSLKIIKDLVLKGSNVNAKTNTHGRTALHLAAEFNFLEIIKFLVENGALVNCEDKRKWIPLHNAMLCYENNHEVVDYLLNNGANINAKTINSTTPLMFAVQRNFAAAVELLLKRGANINDVDHTNWTALHFATSDGLLDVCEILLKYNPDLNVKDSIDGSTPLLQAIAKNNLRIVKLLIKCNADINVSLMGNKSIISLATACSEMTMIKYLLENGAYFDPASILQAMYTRKNNILKQLTLIDELFQACKNNNSAEVRNLIAEGAIIKVKDAQGWTPLHYAVHMQNSDLVDLLLKKGADIAQCTNKGNTALHLAILRKNVNIVEQLLDQESVPLDDFINIKTKDKGTTALHFAVSKNLFEIVITLLRHGAIYNIKNDKNKTPKDLAQDNSIINILQCIDELFGKVEEVIERLKTMKDEEFRVVTNTRNNEGRTLLQLATTIGRQSIASELCKSIGSIKLD